MKTIRNFLYLLSCSLLSSVFLLPATAAPNVPPTVIVQSATMRPGTTLMDVVYRVNDPDDATVKVRALAFKDGVRSFNNVLRPVTFVEGTDAKLGDAIPTNTPHTLTWDVAADWNIDLGQVKFEVLCRDSRKLLSFDWIAIPAAGGQPPLKISVNSPSDAQLLDALFWQYAAGDPALTLTNGALTGNSGSGVFASLQLGNGSSTLPYATPYLLKQMNLDYARKAEISFAENVARVTLQNPAGLHAVDRPYGGLSVVAGWAMEPTQDHWGNPPFGLHRATAVAVGAKHALALMDDGTVIGWGVNDYGETAGMTDVIAIAAGDRCSHALKSDGTVVSWGQNAEGITQVPDGLNNVIKIAAGSKHCLALKGDGTVVGWGDKQYSQASIPPAGLTDVTAIAAGYRFSLAVKGDGTVVLWGSNPYGYVTVPPGLTNVIAVAAGVSHCLALKEDGTVVAWAKNQIGEFGEAAVPHGLTDVIALAAGSSYSMALKSDGTVVTWGGREPGGIAVPDWLSNVIAISSYTEGSYCLAVSREP